MVPDNQKHLHGGSGQLMLGKNFVQRQELH